METFAPTFLCLLIENQNPIGVSQLEEVFDRHSITAVSLSTLDFSTHGLLAMARNLTVYIDHFDRIKIQLSAHECLGSTKGRIQ